MQRESECHCSCGEVVAMRNEASADGYGDLTMDAVENGAIVKVSVSSGYSEGSEGNFIPYSDTDIIIRCLKCGKENSYAMR